MLILCRGESVPWEDCDWGDPAITVVARQKDLSEPGFLRLGMTLFEAEPGSYSTENAYDELYFFLAGSARFESGGDAIQAGTGDVVVVPRGTRVRVTIEEPIRTFCVGVPHWLAGGEGAAA
jgi:ethanolamine utilization protein EutQ (cupin superfamily)